MAAVIHSEWPEGRCGFASGYAAALDLIEKEKWDVVLIELDIPGPGGLDLVSRVSRKVPTLLVSAEPEEIYGTRALRCGSAGYLRRNVPTVEIAGAVAVVLAGGRYVSEELAQHLASRLKEQSGQNRDSYEALKEREFQVLRLIADGQCIKEIAASLSLSSKTVSFYRTRLFQKLRAKTDADLVRYCLDNGLARRKAEGRAMDAGVAGLPKNTGIAGNFQEEGSARRFG
jgi:DNA-binding NarL/FixJ family response regulator